MRFTRRDLPAKDPATFVAQGIANMPNRYEARLTLHTSAETMVEHPSARWGEIQPIDAERCEYRTGDDNLDWLAARLVMLGVDFDLHEPPELIAHLARWGDRLSRATRVWP